MILRRRVCKMEKKPNKKFYWIAIIVVLGIAVSMILWIQSKPRAWVPTGPTPDVPGYGKYTFNSDFPFPSFLDCSVIPPQVSLGPSWNGFQIGKTTYEEMVQILNPESVRWITPNGKIVFKYTIEDGTLGIINACYSGNLLSALNYGTKGDERSFQDYFVQNYGNPDYITWGGYATERTAIWPEKGRLVILEGGGLEPDPTKVILFSPIPFEEFGESWLWQALPDENEDLSKYVGADEPPLPQWEDPWGIATHGTYELRVKQP